MQYEGINPDQARATFTFLCEQRDEATRKGSDLVIHADLFWDPAMRWIVCEREHRDGREDRYEIKTEGDEVVVLWGDDGALRIDYESLDSLIKGLQEAREYLRPYFSHRGGV